MMVVHDVMSVVSRRVGLTYKPYFLLLGISSIILVNNVIAQCTQFSDLHPVCFRCLDLSASCLNGVCRCLSNYYLKNYVCVRKLVLGADCEPGLDECRDQNAECSPQSDTCDCVDGYFIRVTHTPPPLPYALVAAYVFWYRWTLYVCPEYMHNRFTTYTVIMYMHPICDQ